VRRIRRRERGRIRRERRRRRSCRVSIFLLTYYCRSAVIPSSPY